MSLLQTETVYFNRIEITFTAGQEHWKIIVINQKEKEYELYFSDYDLEKDDPFEYKKVIIKDFDLIKKEYLDKYFEFPENPQFFRRLSNMEKLIKENKSLKRKLEEIENS